MKKIFIYITILAGVFTSCQDFLTEEPKTSQSNELTLSGFNGLDDAVAGSYTRFQSQRWYGGSFILASELRCGNAKNPISLPGSGRYRVDPFWTYSANSTSPLWGYAYYTIAAVNNVINALDAVEELVNVDQKDVDNIMAEALFVRALTYLDLVLVYAQPYSYAPESLGVPVVLVTENGSPARNTVKEVYDQIVKDLLAAETLMSDDYTRSGTTDWAAAATKPAIQALLSRVYLYMEDYQKCADYATKVINSNKFELADRNTYLEMWTEDVAQKGGEVIFEMYASIKNNYWDESGWEMISYITSPAGSADVCATRDLLDLYDDGDVRAELYVANENDYFPLKYAGKADSKAPAENNTVILRLSEMYLNRAEALYHGASISGVTAAADLLKITQARGASTISPSATAIFNERRKELAFEGHITFDYARTKTPLVRIDYDGQDAYKDVPFPSPKWALPIPLAEMEANENMEQNPGYN